MNGQGLEVLETTVHKTHEWINAVAQRAHVDQATALKVLRGVLHTLRDRLPIQEAVHFSAQLPLLIRGIYFEGWRPSDVPLKMSAREFFVAVSASISTGQELDPVRMTRAVIGVLNHHMSAGEISKVRHVLPKDLQALWPEPLVTV